MGAKYRFESPGLKLKYLQRTEPLMFKPAALIQSPLYRLYHRGQRHSTTDIYLPCPAQQINAWMFDRQKSVVDNKLRLISCPTMGIFLETN